MRFISKCRLSVKLVLILLLGISLGVYIIYKQQEKLLEDFKLHLEEEIEEALGLTIDIRKINGGIFRPITLEDIEVTYGEREWNQPFITARIIKVNKRLWDLFFIKGRLFSNLHLELHNADLYIFAKFGPKITNQSGRIFLSKDKGILKLDLANKDYHLKGTISDIYKQTNFDIDLNIDSRRISGHLSIGGNKKNPEIIGALNLFSIGTIVLNGLLDIEEKEITFDNLCFQDRYLTKGEIDLEHQKANIRVYVKDKEKINMTAIWSDKFHLKTVVDISHLNVKNHDIVVNLKSDIYINQAEDKKFKNITGGFKTNTCILDYKPKENIVSSFTWNGKMLEVNEFSIGNYCRARGMISFERPQTIDFNMRVNEVEVHDGARFCAMPDDFNFSSTISADINIKGDLRKPDIKVNLVSSKGYLQDIQFESISFNLEGTYPMLIVKDSRINRANSHLIIEGMIDLREITSNNILEDVVIKSDRETIVWEGWDITKKRADSKISLRRSIGDEVSLLYKAYIEDETLPEENNKDTLELEYKILGNKGFKVRLRENEEFFGFENKIRF